MIVIDASATVALLLDQGAQAAAIRARVAAESLHSPHILDLEVASAMRRLVVSRVLEVRRVNAVLEHLMALPVQRYAHTTFLPRIWQLRENVTAYDAAYVALAEALDAPLVTTNGPLARAPGHHATVEVF